MKAYLKRIISLCLLIVMVLTVIPFTANADDLGQSFEAIITTKTKSVCVAVSGTNVQLANVSSKSPQLWVFTKQSDGSYEIKYKSNGKCLDVYAGSSASGSNVQIYDDNNTAAQRWFITKNSNGMYTFRSKAGQCVMDVYGASLVAGSNIWMYTSNGTVAQQFNVEIQAKPDADLVDLGSDIYAVISSASDGRNLSSNTKQINLASNAKTAEQVWRFTKQSDGSYIIKNQYSGYVLDASNTINGTSTDFAMVESNNTSGQRWFVYRNGSDYVLKSKLNKNYVLALSNLNASSAVNAVAYKSGDTAQVFKITNVGAYLSYISPSDIGTNFNASISFASKNIAVSGTNVIIYSASQNSDQVWRFERQSNGSYKIVNNNASEYVLDIYAGSSASGTNVQIYKSNNTAAQRWFLYRKEGRYVFCSALSKNAVMDISEGKTDNMTNVHIWTPNFTDAQLFSINKGNMTAMTYNISCGDMRTARMNNILSIMKSYTPDTIGIQEATVQWMDFLKKNLGSTYGFVGVGRDAGGTGEHSAILYNKHLFTLLESGTKWLSDTPDKPSKISSSYYNRIMTYALLQRKSDGQKLLVVNTHLDHSNDTIRGKQFDVLLKLIDSYRDCPVIMTGDFNTTPGSSVYNKVLSAGFNDASKKASSVQSGATYTEYGAKSQILDYVFTTPEINAKVYRVCSDKFNGAYPSDHNAIYFRYTF